MMVVLEEDDVEVALLTLREDSRSVSPASEGGEREREREEREREREGVCVWMWSGSRAGRMPCPNSCE